MISITHALVVLQKISGSYLQMSTFAAGSLTSMDILLTIKLVRTFGCNLNSSRYVPYHMGCLFLVQVEVQKPR